MNTLIVITYIATITALFAIGLTWWVYGQFLGMKVYLSEKILTNLKNSGHLNDMIDRLDKDLSKEIDQIKGRK